MIHANERTSALAGATEGRAGGAVGAGGWLALAVIVGLAGSVRAGMVTRRWGSPPSGKPSAGAQAPLPTGYAPQTQSPPKIDGSLEDPCWTRAEAMELSRTLDGAGRAAQPAEVRALRDAQNLYLAFRCVEPDLSKLRASRRGHDGAIWEDDSVEVFLGTGGRYFHFGVSAAGSTYDGKVKDSTWNSGLQAAAARAEGAWTAELAIPLAAMIEKGQTPQEWGANFTRNRQAAGSWQESAWSPTLSGNSHVPERFGRLVFSDPPAAAEKEAPAAKGAVSVLPSAEGAGVVRFDLSGLPEAAKVFRADLLVFRTQPVDGQDEEARVDIEIYPLFAEFRAGEKAAPSGKPLALRGPWFDRFDAAEAVREWVSGKTNGGFWIEAGPFVDPASTCLDVAYLGETDKSKLPPQVTDVKVHHRAGQSFITWKEIEDPVGTDEIRWGRFRDILANLDAQRRVRYCVYRSDKRITAGNIHEAELIATVAPLSCWNVNGRNVDRPIDEALGSQYYLAHHQWNPFVNASVEGNFGTDCPLERLVIREGQDNGSKAASGTLPALEPRSLPRGTGLYVHTANAAGRAYYAVLSSIDGVQNASDVSEGNSLAAPVEETAGEGEPVLQKEFPPEPYFNYREKRLHYVRWVAPPYGNLPSQYYNWAVGVPNSHGERMPAELSLHRDGRSYYRTQYRLETDSLVLSPHDFPISTWWYGYHESLGTLKSFAAGAVHNYTERRLLAFIDWAARKWPVDRSRIVVTGCAGGAAGGGALHLGIRHPKVFNLVCSGYGLANYAEEIAWLTKVKRAGSMPSEMARIWGRPEWGVKADTGRNVWDELDLTRIVRELPGETDLPLVSVTGRGMSAPTREFFVAMLEAGQPLMCRFGVYGGGTLLPVSRTGTWSGMIRQDLRRDQSMPAFWGGGASTLWEQAKEPSGNLVVSDGIRWWWGDIGTGFRWTSDDLIDEPARYEITLSWAGGSRVRNPHADVTLRRVQKFRIRPDWEYRYELRNAAGELVEQGKLRPDKRGLLVIKGVMIPAEGVRLIVRP